MNKKLVWIGIVIFITAITSVNAYTNGFTYSNMTCSDLVSIDNGEDFSADFFKHYVEGSFRFDPPAIYGDSPSTHPSGMDLHYVDRVADSSNCIDSYFSSSEHYGLFLYGYLYLLDNVDHVTMAISSLTSDNNEYYCTDTGLMFYKINTLPITIGKGPEFENRLLAMTPPTPLYPDSADGVCDIDSGLSMPDWGDRTTKTYDKAFSLSPGLYFVTVGIASRLASDSHSYTTGKRVGGGLQFKFNDYDNVKSYVINQAVTPRFNIVTDRLTRDELNILYSDRIENDSWICTLAGGQKLTEAGLEGINENTFNAIKTATNFDMSHLCCGNTPNEVYSFKYKVDGAEEEETYLCQDGEWGKGTNFGVCKALIDDNGLWDEQAGTVWKDLMNINNLPYFQIDTGALDGSDGCCGDDYPPISGGDYGYIGTVGGNKRFFCYDTNMDPDNPQFNWLDAFMDKYKIRTIYKENAGSSGNVDVISNSQNWYYCDASGKNLLNNGIRIPENGTFSNAYLSDEMACNDIATILYNDPENPIVYGVCTGPASTWVYPCCLPVQASISTPEDCDSSCYDPQEKPISSYFSSELCDSFKIGCSASDSSDDLTDEDVDTSSCPSDPDYASCLDMNELASNPDLSCLEQAFHTVNCTRPGLCGGGIIVKASDDDNSKFCCAGENAYCMDVLTIDTQNKCMQESGQIYSIAEHKCTPATAGISIGNTGLRCCFGVKTPLSDFSKQLSVSTTRNSSFICFKQGGQDIISDCCYDAYCKNSYLAYANTLSNADNRVLALGGVFHTVENFDVIKENSIVDKMKLFRIPSGSSVKDVRFNPYNTLNLSQFTYLEFDIEFDTAMNVSINDYDMGSLPKYLANGDRPYRRHHAVIPIPKINGKSLAGETPYKLRFTAVSSPAQFMIDNIILTPKGNGLRYSSQNYYCTGGFEGWVADLDPPKTWTNTQLTDWSQYGAYAMTCNSQGAAFGWTGTMCCGDDTKMDYGEFYDDTMYGCFNGTWVKNGWSMGYATGYTENTDPSRDRLRDYSYAGIMYYQNKFIGCQIPNHDAGISVSKYSVPSGSLLVNSFTDSQCTVLGNYYCMDGIWRQMVKTNTGDITLSGQPMYLKLAPSGAELIKNRFETTT